MTDPRKKEEEYYLLDPLHSNPARLRKEREKARKLKKTQWWLTQLNQGVCYYCKGKFPASKLTMDHLVPLARGGSSTKGNIVPSCLDCNRHKKLRIPVEDVLNSGSS